MIYGLIVILLILAILSIALKLFYALLPILIVGGIIYYFIYKKDDKNIYTDYNDSNDDFREI